MFCSPAELNIEKAPGQPAIRACCKPIPQMKIAALGFCTRREPISDLRAVDEQKHLGSIANRLEEEPVAGSDRPCRAGYVEYRRRALGIEVDGAVCVQNDLR
ncbi:MAG: hypothetical protein CAPSK01_001784 [Candidatus Accumulibacter vicinus]|uniref:Uncharacterized protein n=1 Tax=Candidatus Accumulibacter vicinus TaxID=2954382 RepID=A0A084Y2I5_9PROT|nr:MAG: hypothetical protein CAPSK01_001784 [Candidatus Accumulibacter vicinus]